MEFGQELMVLFGEKAILLQLIIVASILLVSRLAAWKIEPKLEAQIRAIESPNHRLLRVLVVLLRRLDWAIFVILSGVALLLIQRFAWPGSDYVVLTALLLALAWLVIALLSQTIRSRLLGRMVSVLVWVYVALVLLGAVDEAALLLDAVGFSIGNFRLSLLLIIKVVVLLGALLWAAISVGNFVDTRLQQTEELTPSLRVLLGKVVKIVLIVTATLVGLSGLGLDLTLFTVFSGAIGVGLGFGLQKVVSNFISGIIILMDRSIKPGDTISLGETFGWIRELRARFVSVVTRDGREYLIPNEDFITHEVINWSFSDELVRLDVNFGVSYDADPHEVSALAVAAAAGCRRVHSGKRPVCWLTGFGDSSLDFVLRFWITDPREGLTNIRGVVLLALWDTFKEHGVHIPYPHREVIMKTPVMISPDDTAGD
ncbi:MAG: mechanosensitive ion channel [Xanthomonadales bacterium]|nr:mechanosensitive ion channel [Xanthomonadales bacterium]